jgi:hypothetical protein
MRINGDTTLALLRFPLVVREPEELPALAPTPADGETPGTATDAAECSAAATRDGRDRPADSTPSAAGACAASHFAPPSVPAVQRADVRRSPSG